MSKNPFMAPAKFQAFFFPVDFRFRGESARLRCSLSLPLRTHNGPVKMRWIAIAIKRGDEKPLFLNSISTEGEEEDANVVSIKPSFPSFSIGFNCNHLHYLTFCSPRSASLIELDKEPFVAVKGLKVPKSWEEEKNSNDHNALCMEPKISCSTLFHTRLLPPFHLPLPLPVIKPCRFFCECNPFFFNEPP